MKRFVWMVWVPLVGCGVFGGGDVDEDAAEVYVGEWAIEALASTDPEDIGAPVDAEGELAIDEELEADYYMVFADGDWAYEIQVGGEAVKADADRIEHEVEGIVGRVPIAGGTPEVLEFLGQLQCRFFEGGLVCNVFGVAQDPDLDEEILIALETGLASRD